MKVTVPKIVAENIASTKVIIANSVLSATLIYTLITQANWGGWSALFFVLFCVGLHNIAVGTAIEHSSKSAVKAAAIIANKVALATVDAAKND